MHHRDPFDRLLLAQAEVEGLTLVTPPPGSTSTRSTCSGDELTLGDLAIRAITIDEVIASKEALGRPKDTAALPALYATARRSGGTSGGNGN